MRREAPDTRFFTEVRDLNLEFLGLVAAARECCHGPVFGLDVGLVEQVGRLNPAQLEAIAEAPCVLAGFTLAHKYCGVTRVAEPASPAGTAEWIERARLFAAGMLTYAWQTTQRDALHAALCVSPDAHALTAQASFRDIRSYADRALQHLEARFRHHVRFWPDLVHATREGCPERLQLARMTTIQLAVVEARRTGRSALPAKSAISAR